MTTGRARRPRLALVSAVARADFCEPLRWFDQFEIWHFYRNSASDFDVAQTYGHHVRFRNSYDLLVGLLKTKPDLIQGSEPYDFPQGLKLSTVALVAAGLLRRPLYFPTLENLRPEAKFRRLRRLPVGVVVAPALRFVFAFYSRRSSIVFALNEGAVANLVAVQTPRAKIRRDLYATWGVDLQRFSPVGPTAPSVSCSNSILFVGRLVEEKGVRQLLQAFQLVSRQIPDASLCFVGDGPLAGDITDFAIAHGLEGRVKLLGAVANSHLPPYFRAATVVATPSLTAEKWTEQVGMVNIQSIACGTPVVSTYSGSIPEFVQDGVSGILVAEGKPEPLADAMLGLLRDDRMRQAMSASGRAYAERRYNAAVNVTKVQEVLLQVLSRGRRPQMESRPSPPTEEADELSRPEAELSAGALSADPADSNLASGPWH